jgi:hypothetical protein
VVTETVVGCKSDFLHFFIVFFVMLCSFTVAGMFLFGHRMIEFSSFYLAMTQTFEILVGNFDFEELAADYPVSAFAWFFCFICLVFLIMFNMVLAIIMDCYGAAKANAALSPPIWTQVADMIRDWRSKVHLDEAILVLRQLPNSQIGPNALMEACPSMGIDQAVNIIEQVEICEANEEEQGLGISDATRLIVGIRAQVATISAQVTEITSLHHAGTALLMAPKDHLIPKAKAKSKANGGLRPQPEPVPFDGPIQKLEPTSETHIRSLEGRLATLEEFLNEAMSYVVFRGREARNRFKEMEDYLRDGRDAASANNDNMLALQNGQGNAQ